MINANETRRRFKYQTRAAFQLKGARGWTWITWVEDTSGGNKHKAILDKAAELGAVAWDFGQADYRMEGEF